MTPSRRTQKRPAPTPVAEPMPAPHALVPGASATRQGVFWVAAAALPLAFAVVSFPSLSLGMRLVGGLVTASLTAGSILAYRWARRRVGRFAAAAGTGLLWAAVLGPLNMLAVTEGRQTALASGVVSGLLVPVVAAVVCLPAVAAVRLGRIARRRLKH